ncbi:penicillin-binding protein [Nitriliruptoraceae bacterium ZYF776]|nr:penicillin-binding protein [Profundirhabdus halotolerans]
MRQWLAIVGAVAVLAAAVGGAYWYLDQQVLDGPAGEEDPADTLERYLAAFERGDLGVLADLVRDPPDDFADLHEQLVDGLELTSLRADASPLEQDVDGRATTTLTVVATSSAVGELRWEAPLRLLRERGRWGVAWEPTSLHPDLRRGLVFDLEVTAVDRAPILAGDGTTELAGPGRRITYGFEPEAVEDADEVVEAFEQAAPGSGAVAERLLDGPLVDGWFYPVVSLAEDRARDAAPALRGVPGILDRTEDGARSLLREGFAQHVVGRVAPATAEQLEQLGPPYEAGDLVGQYGLERELEGELTGSDVVSAVLRDGASGPVRVTLERTQDDPSGPVGTTLDVTVQTAVENALVGVDDPAAIVVVDGADGAVLASASRPLDGFNRAFEGRYAPGAALGPVVVDAAFADGRDVDEVLTCPDEVVVGGYRNVDPEGTDLGEVDLATAVANACVTSFAQLGADLGATALSDAAARFGFGTEPRTPLDAFGATFPAPGDTAELGAAAAGEARVEASPLHLASLAAAAVTGTWRPPYLLEDDGPGTASALTDGTTDALRELLRTAVTDGVAADAEVPGDPPVRGTTATGRAPGGGSHAWFVGAYGDYGVAVLVEDGGSGAEIAAPLAARFVRELRALRDDPGQTEATTEDAEVREVAPVPSGGR